MKDKYNIKKHLKRIFIVVLLVIIVICLNSKIRNCSQKNKMFKIVTNNIELLNQSISSGDYNKAYKIKEVEDIYVYRTSRGTLFVDYFCHGFGIVPSGIYYGFYYVADNIPTGFQATDVELTQKGKGWAWQEASGDNWYYTEKIAEHWYYYEAGF